MSNVTKKRFYTQIFFVFVTFILSQAAFAIGGGGGGDASDPAEDYAENGGLATTTQSGGSSCTIYRPTNLTGNHAVILWGNGTGNRPSTYENGLRHWASWGFVVAAANTTNAGNGQAMLGCLDWLASSSLRPFLDLSNVGTSGHSQGGGGAIMAGVDSRITATAPMLPYTVGLGHNSSSQSQQNGPMLLVSGGSDFIAGRRANQRPVFNRANVPVFWATLDGAGHSLGNDFLDYRGMVTAWFLYTLKSDSSVASFFEGPNCEFCSASGWRIEQKGI